MTYMQKCTFSSLKTHPHQSLTGCSSPQVNPMQNIHQQPSSGSIHLLKSVKQLYCREAFMVRLPPFVQNTTFALSNCGCNWNALTQQSFAFDLACGFSLIIVSLSGLQEFRTGKQSTRHVAITLSLSLEHNTYINSFSGLANTLGTKG